MSEVVERLDSAQGNTDPTLGVVATESDHNEDLHADDIHNSPQQSEQGQQEVSDEPVKEQAIRRSPRKRVTSKYERSGCYMFFGAKKGTIQRGTQPDRAALEKLDHHNNSKDKLISHISDSDTEEQVANSVCVATNENASDAKGTDKADQNSGIDDDTAEQTSNSQAPNSGNTDLANAFDDKTVDKSGKDLGVSRDSAKVMVDASVDCTGQRHLQSIDQTTGEGTEQPGQGTAQLEQNSTCTTQLKTDENTNAGDEMAGLVQSDPGVDAEHSGKECMGVGRNAVKRDHARSGRHIASETCQAGVKAQSESPTLEQSVTQKEDGVKEMPLQRGRSWSNKGVETQGMCDQPEGSLTRTLTAKGTTPIGASLGICGGDKSALLEDCQSRLPQGRKRTSFELDHGLDHDKKTLTVPKSNALQASETSEVPCAIGLEDQSDATKPGIRVNSHVDQDTAGDGFEADGCQDDSKRRRRSLRGYDGRKSDDGTRDVTMETGGRRSGAGVNEQQSRSRSKSVPAKSRRPRNAKQNVSKKQKHVSESDPATQPKQKGKRKSKTDADNARSSKVKKCKTVRTSNNRSADPRPAFPSFDESMDSLEMVSPCNDLHQDPSPNLFKMDSNSQGDTRTKGIPSYLERDLIDDDDDYQSSALSDDDDDDDNLPDVLNTSTPEKACIFKPEEIVWARIGKCPAWPAIVKSVHRKKHKASLYFIGYPQTRKRGYGISTKNLKPYNCPERDSLIASEGSDKFKECVQQVDDYFRKRGLGTLEINSSLDYFKDDESDEHMAMDDLPFSDVSFLEASEDDKEQETEDLTKELEVKKEKTYEMRRGTSCQRKMQKLLDFIMKNDTVKEQLLAIANGTKACERHQIFMTGPASKRNQLKFTGFGPIVDENQQEDLYRHLLKLYEENILKETGGYSGMSYITEVWIPEAILMAIENVRGVSRREAVNIFYKEGDYQQSHNRQVLFDFPQQTLTTEQQQEVLERAKRSIQYSGDK